MSGLFNMDGTFFKFFNGVADVIILSLIWLVFSIPLFTIGASTTALFYVTTRRISDREGYLFKDFLLSFKANFVRATLLWILWCLMIGIVALNIYMLIYHEFNPMFVTILLPIQACIFIELYITSIYMFPLTARFEMGFKQTIKTAFFMANRHIFTTISCLIIGIAVLASAVFVFEPLLFAAVGIYAFAVSHLIMKVFKKYQPEMDEDS